MQIFTQGHLIQSPTKVLVWEGEILQLLPCKSSNHFIMGQHSETHGRSCCTQYIMNSLLFGSQQKQHNTIRKHTYQNLIIGTCCCKKLITCEKTCIASHLKSMRTGCLLMSCIHTNHLDQCPRFVLCRRKLFFFLPHRTTIISAHGVS